MTKFLRNYVNGRWAEIGRTFPNINPVNGSKVGDVSEADQGAVDQAVKGPRAALPAQVGSAIQEITMKQLIESGAARIAAEIQRVGANFDFEVLSLPGGSVIAALLWLYASTIGTPKRTRPQYRVVDEVSTIHAK
jgi:hypothetical protein